MRRIAAVFGFLSLLGCKPRPFAPPVYPILLIGQGSLDVRDSEDALTSVPGASSLNLNERVILDSSGLLFKVKLAKPVPGQESILWSMGTKRVRYSLELERPTRPSWPEVQRLAHDQLHAPQILELHSVAELIAGAREAWRWRQ